MKDLDTLISNYIHEDSDELYLSFPPISEIEELKAFYALERKAYKYARNFFLLLDVSGIGVKPELLPIIFRDEMAGIAIAVDNDEEHVKGCFMSGNGITSAVKQAVIYIDLPRQKRAVLGKKLKQYIRHEVIHYYLWLQDLPNDDDCALFWAYCNIYDGGAYASMDDEEQSKYDEFMEKRKEYPQARYASLRLLANAVIMKDKNAMQAFQFRYEFEKQFQ